MPTPRHNARDLPSAAALKRHPTERAQTERTFIAPTQRCTLVGTQKAPAIGPRWPGLPGALASCALLALPAAAQSLSPAPGHTWALTVEQAFAHDDNLYRLASGVTPGNGLSRSDDFSRTSLDLAAAWPLGRHRLWGQAGLDLLRYRRHTEQNHTGHDAAAGLAWSAPGAWSGELAAGQSRTLRPLDAAAAATAANGDTPPNLETNRRIEAVLRRGGKGLLTVEGGLMARSLDYADPAFATRAFDAQAARLGLRWQPSAVGSLQARWRHGRTRYDAGADAYDIDALDLQADWRPRTDHHLHARLSPLRTRHDRFDAQDVRTVTGAIAWAWNPPGRWSTRVRAVRDLGQDADFERYGSNGDATAAAFTSSGHVDDGVLLQRVSLGATWQASAKVHLTLNASDTRRTLAAAQPANDPLAQRGRDRTRQATATLRWTPLQRVVVGCDAGTERRSPTSGTLSSAYRAGTVGCFGRWGW